ncbi:7917_t:CDS:2 [Acaulospora colombiana]|uniref:7917_t:CDS:1 n=1 Tax=Acaulospora colombiana TaxID=27376 RepID=A0ACA9M4R3_9GLOM|nr:7917_t:CDS:2 [Acaulospora colombiana]
MAYPVVEFRILGQACVCSLDIVDQILGCNATSKGVGMHPPSRKSSRMDSGSIGGNADWNVDMIAMPKHKKKTSQDEPPPRPNRPPAVLQTTASIEGFQCQRPPHMHSYLPEGCSKFSRLDLDLALRGDSGWFSAVEDALGGGLSTLLRLEEAALFLSDWGEIFENGVVDSSTPDLLYTEFRGNYMPVVVVMPLNLE